MPVHYGNIVQVIERAWTSAQQIEVEGANRKIVNRNRSRAWLRSLVAAFKDQYAGRRHRVFSVDSDENREHFKRNEFLFDLMVCSVSTTESLQKHPNPLEFIAECHWQIESEFSRTSTREIVIDMSKLVVGSATHKLFVTSHRARGNRPILEQCSEIAGRCNGQLYFSFVSHPDDWPRRPQLPAVYTWVAGDWHQLA